VYQQLILDKIASTIQETAPGSDDRLLELIDGAGRIFLAGAGRSALVSRFFAMRLVHSGYQVNVVGEVVTPSIQEGDLLIVISGSGGTKSLLPFIETAKKQGAKVAVISMKTASPMAEMADVVVQIGRDSSYEKILEMPMGTTFELSTLIYLEGTIAKIIHAKDLTEEKMRATHANLE
jgi:6-phospho-3-hexuloisomerase